MRLRSVFLLLLPLSLAACSKSEPTPSAEPAPSSAPTAAPTGAAPTAAAPSPAAVEEAKTIFAQRCSPCHGPQGKGDGPASAGLTPKPRDFSDHSWQTSVTDDHIEKIIQYGGAAVGKSPAMPANPDLTSKPEVVSALRVFIRDLGK